MSVWNFTTCILLQVFLGFILFKSVACEKKSCPDPGVSKHGTREGECCSSGNGLIFSCEDGFELVGKEIILCLSTGNWTSPRPRCRHSKDHCELPPQIPHGILTGEKDGDYYLIGEKAQILCDPGYVRRGPEFVVCKKDGEWDSELGQCTEIHCETPPPLANGTILELQSTDMRSFPHGFVITYVCDKGYGLIGNSLRICLKSGWSGKPPYCEDIQCPDPGILEHGYKLGNNYVVGSSVHFSCFEGYDLLGSVDRYCMPDGQWTGELARCDVPSNYCPNPGIPIKGFKNSTSYHFGDIVRFDCQQGYILLGSEVRECLIDHSWSGTEAKCLGPYNFDNVEHVRDSLKERLNIIEEEKRTELQNKDKTLPSSGPNGYFPVGGLLDFSNRGRLILYFVFDVSDSIGPKYFHKSIQIAKAIVKKVGISENGARVGALTFSDRTDLIFTPMNFNTIQDVLDALDKITFTGGRGAPNSVFSVIRHDVDPQVKNLFGETNVKSVIFLFTDGNENMGRSPSEEADILKKEGADIYCIGITRDVRKRRLDLIASKWKNAIGVEYPNVYILHHYPSIAWFIQGITSGIVDFSQCGLGLENVGYKEDQERTVRGGENSQEPWPWMAALYMSKDEFSSNYNLKCGGTIIHRHFILTAAQCMHVEGLNRQYQPRDKNSIIIKLGLTDKKDETFVQEFKVLKMYIHPRYKTGSNYDYDIALLQLERPIEYSAYIRPICLPPKDLPNESLLYRPNSAAWATGWGFRGKVSKHSHAPIKVSQNLKLMYLPIQTRDSCQESLRSIGANASSFTDRMICAGEGKGGVDTCGGDGGGPLMQSQNNSEGFLYWTQVGIISWGIGCRVINTYGYYTHLQMFVPWIEETIVDAIKDM